MDSQNYRKCEKATIIGAGPAGITAAIQLKRSGLDPLLLEKYQVGGLLKNALRVENYPGFPEGISGPALVKRFLRHLHTMDVRSIKDEVKGLFPDGDQFRIETGREVFFSETVIVATGTKGKKFPPLHLPQNEIGHRFLDEIYPLLRVRNRRIVIVGAGDAAFDYALNLSRFNRVTILNRTGKTRCLPLLRERAVNQPGITYKENTAIGQIASLSRRGMELICRTGDKNWPITADYVIFAIGRKMNLDFLSPGLRKRMKGLEKKGRLYLAGDVKGGDFRQAVIAAGEGMRAGMRIALSFAHGLL